MGGPEGEATGSQFRGQNHDGGTYEMVLGEMQPVLVHGKFCKINDPVSSINSMGRGGARVDGDSSTVKRGKLDPALSKSNCKKTLWR